MTDFRRLINLVEGVEEQRIDELRFPWFRKKAEPTAPVDLSRLDRKPQAAPAADEPAPVAAAPSHTAPEIGAIFQYKGRSFAVTAYMTEVSAAGMFGKRNRSLIACRPEKATWVMGMGGAGCVAPINAITLTGQNKWTEEVATLVQDKADMLVQKGYTIKNPGA